jgi:hypothetical protein
MFWPVMALISSTLMQPAHADSLATCDEIKAKSGVSAAYLECVAKQNADNYLPWSGPAPGMTMDQMDNSIDKTLCEGEASFCDGHQPGEKVGSCVCK